MVWEPEWSLLESQNLIDIIESAKLMKIGTDVRSDIRKVGRQYKLDVAKSSFFDLRFMACYAGFQAFGLASLVQQGLQRRLSKWSTIFKK